MEALGQKVRYPFSIKICITTSTRSRFAAPKEMEMEDGHPVYKFGQVPDLQAESVGKATIARESLYLRAIVSQGFTLMLVGILNISRFILFKERPTL
jgi:hypothetical protein